MFPLTRGSVGTRENLPLLGRVGDTAVGRSRRRARLGCVPSDDWRELRTQLKNWRRRRRRTRRRARGMVGTVCRHPDSLSVPFHVCGMYERDQRYHHSDPPLLRAILPLSVVRSFSH